ncbi:S41 family peptidase [Thermoflavifilum thermophilum]|uniref:Peptidase family S41 n=1 Tax=Thermoflavifilum thermophilum TaxID=1393122 RepID=A0A1I7NAJ1_9BACT|nr:S41 family peptidase [Thermoflavifilum thermophilum]SFV31680.1 Peptidase family S41 [Thermoflavifilum thermophilum]
MKRSFFSRNVLSSLLLGLILAAGAGCKKNHNNNPPTSNTISEEDSLKYYIYHYMLVTFDDGAMAYYHDSLPLYLWYHQVPTSTINPFDDTKYPKGEDLLNAIISYPINPQTGKAIDRYSFLDRQGAVSGLIQGGITGDMGFQPAYAYDNNNQLHLVVLYVYKNSSAGQQGVQRGWEITAINGNTNISDQNLVVNALYNSQSAQFTFKKRDGSSVTLTIQATQYQVNPVLFDTVYTLSNGKKVGYFVFNQFIDIYDSNNNPTETKNELDAVFQKFKDSAVSSIVIDERYNGGGAVSTAEYIDNTLAPASANGKIMYTYVYNDRLTAHASDLQLPININFQNTGSFNLEHVFFIVSRNTVSASELTINNLKPYMDVQLVGDTTYGKPVGFFGWPIEYDSAGTQKHVADLYSVNFQTKNATGYGDYFTGMVPNKLEYDYIGYNWGDPNDPNLQDVFNYLTTGNYRTTSAARLASQPQQYRVIQGSLPLKRFEGMVNYRAAGMFKPYLR